jgi:hypothetical protein
MKERRDFTRTRLHLFVAEKGEFSLHRRSESGAAFSPGNLVFLNAQGFPDTGPSEKPSFGPAP